MLSAALPVPLLAGDGAGPPHVDSCNASLRDNYTLEVVCGYTDVPELDIDVQTKFGEDTPDPFRPTPVSFVAVGEPWVLDLRQVEKLDNAPYFECFGKPASTLEARPDDTRSFDAVYAEYTIERITYDLHLVALGKPPICYDVLGSASTRGEADDFELDDPVSPNLYREDLSASAADATADLSPVELENLSRSFEMEAIEKPAEVKVKTVEEIEARDAAEALARQVDPEEVLGMGFRQEFNRLGRCPRRFKNLDALRSFAEHAEKKDFHVDVKPLVAHGRKTEILDGTTSVSVICAYNAHKNQWTGADFFCRNATTCFSQLQPSLPRDCQKIDRKSGFTDEWSVSPDHCMQMGSASRHDAPSTHLRFLSLGHGVYLSVVRTGESEPSYALVFAPEDPGRKP